MLECELIDREHRARGEAGTKIFDYLETWYNPRRRHSALDYLSPMEYERRWQERSSTRSLYLSTKAGRSTLITAQGTRAHSSPDGLRSRVTARDFVSVRSYKVGCGGTLVRVDKSRRPGQRSDACATSFSAPTRARERIQYGTTFSFSRNGDFGAFVRCSEPGANLRLHRGGRLRGRYPHLEGHTVKRMRLADRTEANARAFELRAMVKEWCELGDPVDVAWFRR